MEGEEKETPTELARNQSFASKTVFLSPRLHSVSYFLLLGLLCSVQVGGLNVTKHTFAVLPENHARHEFEYAVSHDDAHLLLGVKYDKDFGGGKAFLYKRLSATEWKRMLTFDHPKGWAALSDSVHLVVEKKWAFASLVDNSRNLADSRPECDFDDACGEVSKNVPFRQFMQDGFLGKDKSLSSNGRSRHT